MFQHHLQAFEIMPIALARKQRAHAPHVQLSACKQNPQHRIVARLGDVVRRLLVVRIRPAFEEQPREPCVLGDSGRAVDCGFENRARIR